MYKNANQVQAYINTMVVEEGKGESEVWMAIRGDQGIKDAIEQGTSMTVQKYREAIEGTAKDTAAQLKEAERRGPLWVNHLKLQIKSGALLGDIQAEIATYSDTNPRNVRDAISLLSRLEQNPTAFLKEACEFIDAMGSPVAVALTERFNQLFPQEKSDE